MMLRLTCTIAALLVAATGDALARDEVIPLETPPYFAQLDGGYMYRTADQATASLSGQQLTIFEQTVRSWQIGGHATVPIAFGLGARVRVQGGSSRTTQAGFGSESGGAIGQGEVFWRDPTRGQIGVGYGYGWSSPRTPSSVQSTRTHRVPVFASLYMPDLDGSTVDWNASFTYDFQSLRGDTGTTSQWAYEVRGSSIWYVNRLAAFEGGVRYQRLLASQQSDVLEGTFALELLVPSGRALSYATVSAVGAVGRAEAKDLAAPFSSLSRMTWQVGGEVTVFFPGVDSLVELNRAYR